MESTFAVRFGKLKQDDFQTALVVEWLQATGHTRFQGPVYLPPILSLGVKDKSLASLAESCLRPHDLSVLSSEKYLTIGIYMFVSSRLQTFFILSH